jgi:hypothetical protein
VFFDLRSSEGNQVAIVEIQHQDGFSSNGMLDIPTFIKIEQLV